MECRKLQGLGHVSSEQKSEAAERKSPGPLKSSMRWGLHHHLTVVLNYGRNQLLRCEFKKIWCGLQSSWPAPRCGSTRLAVVCGCVWVSWRVRAPWKMGAASETPQWNFFILLKDNPSFLQANRSPLDLSGCEKFSAFLSTLVTHLWIWRHVCVPKTNPNAPAE